MHSTTDEANQLLYISCLAIVSQEAFGSFLMLALLFPFGSFLGDTWPSWITHFFLVMLVSEGIPCYLHACHLALYCKVLRER